MSSGISSGSTARGFGGLKRISGGNTSDEHLALPEGLLNPRSGQLGDLPGEPGIDAFARFLLADHELKDPQLAHIVQPRKKYGVMTVLQAT
jgi:hypothetical protein